MIEFIALDRCVKGHVYRLHSRNLSFGVFDGAKGFIGLREKFGARYLAVEYHGHTAFPLSDTGAEADPSIQLVTSLGSCDSVTGELVAFDKPVDQGGKGWFFLNTGEPSLDIRPCNVDNEPLTELLNRLEVEAPKETT